MRLRSVCRLIAADVQKARISALTMLCLSIYGELEIVIGRLYETDCTSAYCVALYSDCIFCFVVTDERGYSM